jgi:hypothetical protein
MAVKSLSLSFKDTMVRGDGVNNKSAGIEKGLGLSSRHSQL